MSKSDPHAWMWSEALEVLNRVERMHSQLFQPIQPAGRAVAWEPPVDLLETEEEVLILAALPGVNPDEVEAVIHDGHLSISGQRILPAELRRAAIHRLELPQGRFERHVALPAGRYDAVRRTSVNGCLVISLRKTA